MEEYIDNPVAWLRKPAAWIFDFMMRLCLAAAILGLIVDRKAITVTAAVVALLASINWWGVRDLLELDDDWQSP